MQHKASDRPHLLALAVCSLGSWTGCIDDGPAIQARRQSIAFSEAPQLAAGQTSTTVSATASSGLPVRYGSLTPAVCSVDDATGRVTATASGACAVAANQEGNDEFAAAAQVTQDLLFSFGASLVFSPAPNLRVYDLATVTAVDGTGLPVTYVTTTPGVCTIDATTGLLAAVSAGECSILAASRDREAELDFAIDTPSGSTVPSPPTGITASMGDRGSSVFVQIGAISGGGSHILGYTVRSNPPGITAAGASFPLTVTCPSSCAGFSFAVSAANALGTGPSSELAHVLTSYDVIETFHEPDTQPNESLFVGTFTFDATTSTVTALHGQLSESMTGGATAYPNDTMTWLPLNHQLSSLPVAFAGVSGLLVTTFLLSTTNTLSNDPTFEGSDGWTPGTGLGLYYGYPGANPGNAYARIFVNTADPSAALTQAQIDKLAYADCTAGGLMGATCMTGTTVAGYGSVGAMSGFPISQRITRR